MTVTSPRGVAPRDVSAADAMSSPVVTVPETATIFDAWSVLVHCRVRHAVVVHGDRCVGVVDDRDLVEAWHRGPGALRATAVKALLRDHTSCVLSDAPLREVARIMNEARTDAVPVVETDGKLVGLVTAGDVVHAVAEHGLHAEDTEADGPRQ